MKVKSKKADKKHQDNLTYRDARMRQWLVWFVIFGMLLISTMVVNTAVLMMVVWGLWELRVIQFWQMVTIGSILLLTLIWWGCRGQAFTK